MKSLLMVLLLLVGSTCWAASPADSIVMLFVMQADNKNIAGGTGFELEAPNGLTYTITNAHVCAISRTGFMTGMSQVRQAEYSLMQILKSDPELDLCALTPIPKSNALKLGPPPHPQQNIVIMGHPLLGPLSISQGFVESMEAGEFITSARVYPGSSGSPVLDAVSPVVVGVVHMYDTEDRTSININVEALRYFLKDLH